MNLPDVNVPPHAFYDMFNELTRPKLLAVGIELGVFDHLREPETAEAAAAAMNTHRENTRHLLDGLTACGLLIKEEGSYRNTPQAQIALIRGEPTYMGEMFLLIMQVAQAPLDRLTELLTDGPPPPEDWLTASEDLWVRYTYGIANFQRAGLARQAAEIVSALPEFPTFGKMLDLGAGPGFVAMAVVDAHPSMTGVVFDQPAVSRIAQNFIDEYGMADRVSVIGGDYRQDTLGDGYDLIWVSATLNYAGPLDKMVRKIHDALNPGGVFVSLSDSVTDEGTQPAAYIFNALPSAFMGEDMRIPQGAIAESMRRAGFASIDSRTIDTHMVAMDLDIARKSG
uniref:Dimerisation domain-containing protein n=1 Tax=Candidatus Kentrum sp. FW TaxID=2126338 RepID=A0A450SZK6_9GAMM|nr:MAG: Dimerisation domain-containing protein [Candidatus Kentron sp. FW]